LPDGCAELCPAPKAKGKAQIKAKTAGTKLGFGDCM
jgi:hypothetical protein